MHAHLIASGTLAVMVALGLPGGTRPAPPAGPAKAPTKVNELSQEVAALQTLYALNLTPRQLEKLRKLGAETSDRPAARQAPRASAALARAMTDLRAALVKAEDDKRIDGLLKKVEDLRNTEKPELDDGIDVTDEAREHAPDAVRLLSPGQVAAYVGGLAEDIADPYELLLDGMERARAAENKDWRGLREALADEVSRLVAGLDPEQIQTTADQVSQLLIMARSMKDADFKKQHGDLEKSAREIIGKAGPFEVLRHVMEQSMAELLANPRLTAALDARLKYLRSALVVRPPLP